MPARFGDVPFYVGVLKVLGWLLLVGGIVGGAVTGMLALSAAAAFNPNGSPSGVTFFAPFAIGAIGGMLTCLAFQVVAHGLELLLALEDNSRRTAEVLAEIESRTRPATPAGAAD